MRSYGQYCALAKALDVVGDRWSLLIVRELLIRGGCRYTDLRDGLPGIATNLLADRVRHLEECGVVRREEAPPPIAASLFHLTARGAELEAALRALGRWGAPLLSTAPERDTFRAHWLALPAAEWLRDHSPESPPVRLEIRMGGTSVIMLIGAGNVAYCPVVSDAPDAVLSGKRRVVLGLLAGKLDLAQARAAGLHYQGDPQVLRRVQPLAVE